MGLGAVSKDLCDLMFYKILDPQLEQSPRTLPWRLEY